MDRRGRKNQLTATPAISYAGALGAGFVSFASPCVLPLVPAYLSFLAGVSFEELAVKKESASVNWTVIAAALAFVVGFNVVFIALGASATYVSRLLADHLNLVAKIAGVVIVIFGLHYAGLLRWGFLHREGRFHPTGMRGVGGAFVMGLAFAFGWTPCVGPILATVLTLAGASGSLWQGVALLACYGAGIGVPFLLAAFAIRPFMRVMSGLRGQMRAIEVSFGGLMIATGILIYANSLENVSGWLLNTFPALGRVG